MNTQVPDPERRLFEPCECGCPECGHRPYNNLHCPKCNHNETAPDLRREAVELKRSPREVDSSLVVATIQASVAHIYRPPR